MAGFGFGGLQFQPGVAQNGEKTGNGQRGRLQEPIQVLSTRLPKFFGAQSIAPAALLQGQGGMGQPAARGNVVAQALAQLAGLPPGMAPSGGGFSQQFREMVPGGGITGGMDLSRAGLSPAPPPAPPPSPPPVFMPPPTMPTPVIRPGDQPSDNTPDPPLRIGGQLPLPGSIVRDDGATFPREGEDVIRLLASRLFR